MSYTSMLEIKFLGDMGSAIDVLNILLDHGWSTSDHGSITYLPVGDGEMYNWQRVNMNAWSEVQIVLEEKVVIGESIGIVLTWKDTSIGGDFHIDLNKSRLSAGWSVNRKTMEGGFTDHSWYLSKILVPLVSNDLRVESFKCIDCQ